MVPNEELPEQSRMRALKLLAPLLAYHPEPWPWERLIGDGTRGSARSLRGSCLTSKTKPRDRESVSAVLRFMSLTKSQSRLLSSQLFVFGTPVTPATWSTLTQRHTCCRCPLISLPEFGLIIPLARDLDDHRQLGTRAKAK